MAEPKQPLSVVKSVIMASGFPRPPTTIRAFTYSGQFQGAIAHVPGNRIVAVPADLETMRGLREAQQGAISAASQRIHDIIYRQGPQSFFEDEFPKSYDELKGYAKAGQSPNNELMVAIKFMAAPVYVREGLLGYLDFEPAGLPPVRYDRVRTVARLSRNLPPGVVSDLINRLSRITYDGATLPVPVDLSSSVGANVVPVFTDPDMKLRFRLIGHSPIALFTVRGQASTQAGMFGTFGGAVNYKLDRDPRDHHIVVIGEGKNGAPASALARELFEEASITTNLSYPIVDVFFQQDLQVSSGAIEVIENVPVRSFEQLTRQALDASEFHKELPVVAIPLDYAHMVSFMCRPVDGQFEPRLVAWSAIQAVRALEFVDPEQAQALEAALQTPQTMEAAFNSIDQRIIADVGAAMSVDNRLTLVR
jgi:8-oxo-dGTP pyrophosphatase MutT (NUDIX family)